MAPIRFWLFFWLLCANLLTVGFGIITGCIVQKIDIEYSGKLNLQLLN
jgi:hypothetical protein